MSAFYDFYQNPPSNGRSKRQRFHARLVAEDTITLDKLADLIHEASSLTTGDVVGAVGLLTEYMVKYLKDGYRVYIEGLGYFQLTLSCPPVQSTSEIRAESIKAKSITFRPDLEVKRELKTTTFTRKPEKNHSKERSAEDIDRLLTSWFSVHDTLTRRTFQGLCGFTQPTANRRLKELVQSGRLLAEGEYRQFPSYRPAEGHFGR